MNRTGNENMQERPLYGLVLAGGRSSRMGRDKATLPHPDGRTLARRCHDLLDDAGCRKVLLSLRADQEIPGGFSSHTEREIIRDPKGESMGPMAGMIAAFQSHPEADWLVAACDLPRLDLTTLETLLNERKTGEAFLAYRSEFDGLPEPLCAFYAREALPVLEAARDNGFRCPRKILIRNDCRLLAPVTPRALENANTPLDWETATAP